MPDRGARYADKAIAKINQELRKTYKTAQQELTQKLKDFNRKFDSKDKEKREQVREGKISKQDYQNWLAGQVFMRNQWESKIRQVTAVMQDHNQQSMKLINEGRFDTFAENYYAEAFKSQWIVQDISFGIYNTQAIAELIKNNPQILPERKINEKKDYDWNYQKVNNIIKQGIIQGEGIPEITKRLCEDLSSQNESRMRMFARTGITEAQNSGRQVQMEQAADMGIEVNKQWIATMDGRTRDSHRWIDGEEVAYNEDFSNGLEYPGDPSGDPEEVYNCRCTMKTIYPKYEDRSKQWREGVTIDGQDYEEWKAGKKAQDQVSNLTEVQGKDISMTWKRRESEFKFEIQDVIAAQGFDGKPTIVSESEFNEAVKQSNFIAQRTYSAPTQEILDAYRDQLYNGEWYVDCSTGGAQYGQGMYCAADYEGKLTDGIKNEMHHYQGLGEMRNAGRTISDMSKDTQDLLVDNAIKKYFPNATSAEKSALEKMVRLEVLHQGNYSSTLDSFSLVSEKNLDYMKPIEELRNWKSKNYSYVETFTLRPDAKIITYKELQDIQQGSLSIDYRAQVIRELLSEKTLTKDEYTFVSYNLGAGSSWEEAHGAESKLKSERVSELVSVFKSIGEQATERWNAEYERRREAARVYREKYSDIGSLAAALGYDAINAERHGQSGSYTVILNRTKCVFLRRKND